MSAEHEVIIDVRDAVQIITINRPDARNAVNRAVATAIDQALDDLEANDALRVGVLTGAGGTFSAGMDLKAFLRGESPTVPGRGLAGVARQTLSKPLIAAVEGYALAGGFEIALGCDLVVAARTASFGIPEVKRSLLAAGGGLVRLPRRIPYHLAMELALTGERISAERAFEMGLVNRLVEEGEALDGALELAAVVAANGPLAVEASKRLIQQSTDWTESEAWEAQDEFVGRVFASEDAREGAAAFAEKRDPVWRGR
jgi:enoyl-CoA hydratase